MWSGQHKLPDTSRAQPEDAPPAPEWINADGAVDPSKAPEKVGVLDESGKPLRDANDIPVQVNFSPERPSATQVDTSSSGVERYNEKAEDGALVEVVEVDMKAAAK